MSPQRSIARRVTTPKDTRSEKQVEHAGDLLMQTLGFTVIRFSQSRATMQTPGIPDRRYMRPGRDGANLALHYRPPLRVWWEAKREAGKQSPAQRRFEMLAQSCHEDYVCDTDADLLAWCKAKGLCR